MISFKQFATVASAIIVAASTVVYAAEKSPAESAQEYRQAGFEMIRYHFGPMAGMVKGEIPFDAATFKTNAEAVATLSKFPMHGFIAGSYEGDTEAKPEIEKNMDDFKSKMETFQVAAADLAKAAGEAKDVEGIKPAFGKTAESCKACHKEYREEK
ncbi:c-type cytochrome [Thiolinea disciformis]|uniref:c-type cytochrome n=1 Tax=Thiolinea disciformis TaxID=125614 RepID=UPI00037995F4|nr:cytochrome c [Thiolinea disciformis]